MSSTDCSLNKPYPVCCKPAFDFVADSFALVAEDCDKLVSDFGESLALSADGRILVVGAPFLIVDNVQLYGAVFVYEQQKSLGASIKTPRYKLLQRIDAEQGNAGLMGYKVAISGDGTRIAASAINRTLVGVDDPPCSGVVFIYDQKCKNGKTQYALVQRLYAQKFDGQDIVYDRPGAFAGGFGFQLALSFSGRVLISGISTTNAPQGKVYIYEDSTCTQLTTGCCVKPEPKPLFVFRQNMDKLTIVTDSGVSSTGQGLPDSVALDGDGATVVLGCSETALASGQIVIYKRLAGTNTWQFDQVITPPGASSGDHFGVSVDITADGTRIVGEASGILVNPPRGYGMVFYRADKATPFSFEATLPSSGPDFNVLNTFGVQIAISDNGCIAAIGYEGTKCLLENNCGDVVIYERKCSVVDGETVFSWNMRQRLFEPVSRPEHRYGSQIALDAKGLIMAVSSPAPQPSSLVGKVYTYTAPTTC